MRWCFPLGTKITPRAARKAATDGLTELLIPSEEIFGRYAADDLINETTGEIYIEFGRRTRRGQSGEARRGGDHLDRPA